ncbi:uncharacterized protein LOC113309217 isoform X2 [Papaver somniferum]|uniref:uncharacterized protein LOC113309217 isoform X2 n=1 Tax=Papaver somniferum TaxID=3469 RepID=UPI000E6F46B2|nr:uncharacterized protein LOC113309217 isoform X2 [Papaver somniferum]
MMIISGCNSLVGKSEQRSGHLSGIYTNVELRQKLILAKNVVALFKKEKYIKGLQNLCAENLMEFLGQEVDPQHCSKSTVT